MEPRSTAAWHRRTSANTQASEDQLNQQEIMSGLKCSAESAWTPWFRTGTDGSEPEQTAFPVRFLCSSVTTAHSQLIIRPYFKNQHFSMQIELISCPIRMVIR